MPSPVFSADDLKLAEPTLMCLEQLAVCHAAAKALGGCENATATVLLGRSEDLAEVILETATLTANEEHSRLIKLDSSAEARASCCSSRCCGRVLPSLTRLGLP